MALYSLVIDETGNFSPNDPLNFVGGYLLKNITVNDFDNKIEQFIDDFNIELNNRKDAKSSDRIKYPNDMHYTELLYEQNRNNDKHNLPITINSILAKEFLDRLFEFIKLNVEKIVYTANRVEFYANEQSSYVEHLKTLLISCSKDLEIKKDDLFKLYISTRRKDSLFGDWGLENKKEYELQLENNSKQFLVKYTDWQKSQVEVSLLVNNKYGYMTIADICVGSVRAGKIGKDLSKLASYSVSNLNFLLNDNDNTFLGKIKSSIDAISLIELGSYITSPKKDLDTKWDSMFLSKIGNIKNIPDEYNKLENLVFKLLENLIKEISFEVITINKIENWCKLLKSSLQNSIDPISKKIMLSVYWAEVQLLAHGYYRNGKNKKLSDKLILDFRDYIKKESSTLFKNPIEAFLKQIEYNLIIIQEENFNYLNFMGIEKKLNKEKVKYKEILKILDYKNGNEDILARITGTIGQAYAFIADMPGINKEDRNINLDFSRSELTEDISMLSVNSYLWYQGVNFLISLEWMAKDLDKAMEFLSLILNTKKLIPSKNLCNIVGENALTNICSKEQKNYIILNQLRLLDMAIDSGKCKIQAEDLLELLLDYSAQTANYPNHQIVKWILTILIKTDNTEIPKGTQKILANQLLVERPLLLLEFMRMIELVVFSSIATASNYKGLAIKSAQNILKEISREEHFNILLKDKEWVKELNKGNVEIENIDDVVKILPYYYS